MLKIFSAPNDGTWLELVFQDSHGSIHSYYCSEVDLDQATQTFMCQTPQGLYNIPRFRVINTHIVREN